MKDNAKVPATLAISELKNLIVLNGETEFYGIGKVNPLVANKL